MRWFDQLHMKRDWPLWIAGFSLVVGLICVFTSLPPGVPNGDSGQRLVIYPLLLASNSAGLPLLGLSLILLIVLGWITRRRKSSQRFYLILAMVGLVGALVANFYLDLPLPLIMALPIVLVFSALSIYFSRREEQSGYGAVLRVVGLMLLSSVFLCNASLLLPFDSLEQTDSVRFQEHLYHLTIMDSISSGFLDREAIVFRCDLSGILCRKIYTSIPSSGCTVTNQILTSNTYLVAVSNRELYLQMGDQQITLVE